MAVPTMPSHQRTISSVSSIPGVDDDIFHTLSGFDNFGNEDDDISFDDFDENRDGLEMSTSSLGDDGTSDKPARKGKKQTSTAEKKATHNAVERARRESLNGRFLVLADMLPGMNHVKRASKAAIVNKSIALINDLQGRERKLAKENQALKAEIAALKERWASGGPATGNGAAPAVTTPSAPYQSNPMATAQAQAQAHAQAQAQAHAQAQAQAQMQAHAAAMAGMGHHPHGFPMMHPAAAAAAMAHMTAANNGAQAAAHHGQQGQERSASLPNIGMPIFPGFPAIFNPMAAHEHQQQQFSIKTENGPSPSALSDASQGSGSHRFGDATLSYDTINGAMPIPGAVHDGQHTASPNSSFCNPSPAGTVASLVSDKAASDVGGNKTATSPASSHSVPTPGNTYSPVPLPSTFDSAARRDSTPATNASQSSTSANAAAGPSNPALAAFDTSADAAYLAAQFGPRELQKAQSELQAFIAYQQRLSMGMAAAAAAAGMGGMFPAQSGAGTSNGTCSPTMPQQQSFTSGSGSANGQMGSMGFGGFPGTQPMVGSPGLPSPTATGTGSQNGMGGFNFTQQQQMHLPQPTGMSTPGGIPAWQTMMMAAHQQQQQGLTTYGGLVSQF